MQNGTKMGAKLFIKAFIWTVIALSLIFIGYFGAEMLWG